MAVLTVVSGTDAATVTVPWTSEFSLGRVANGFSSSVNGTRSVGASETVELWSGTAVIRALPDLRVAGIGLTRAASTGGAVTVLSTAAADTSFPGAGANSVLVTFIQAGSLWERFGVASMLGLAAATVYYAEVDASGTVVSGNAVTDAVRITGAWVLTAGGGGGNGPRAVNAGRISARIAGVEQHSISVGVGVALGAFLFVPRGFYCVLGAFGLTATDPAALTVRLWRQRWSVDSDSGEITGLGCLAPVDVSFPAGAVASPLKFEERLPPCTDVWVTAFNATGSAEQASALMSFALIQDPLDMDPNPERQPPRSR